jgi:hypothetical protein
MSYAGVGEFAEDNTACANFLVADFRMHVQVMAQFNEARQFLGHQCTNGVCEWMTMLMCG